MTVIWVDPTPENTCDMCVPFVGMLFSETAAPQLPAHPDCQCYLIADTEGRLPTVWSWDDMPPATRQAWVRFTAWQIRNSTTISPFNASLVEDAITYNQNRQEQQDVMTEKTLTVNHSPHLMQFAASHDKTNRAYQGRIITAGVIRNELDQPGDIEITAEAIKTAVADGSFEGVSCFVDHPGWFDTPSLKNLFGVWSNVIWDDIYQSAVGTLRHYEGPTSGIADTFDQILNDTKENKAIPDVGVSIVFYPKFAPRDNKEERLRVISFKKITCADIVFMPAADGRILRALSAINQSPPKKESPKMQDATPAKVPDTAWLEVIAQEAKRLKLSNSNLPKATQDRLNAQHFNTPDELDTAIQAAQKEIAEFLSTQTIQLPNSPRRGITSGQMTTPEDSVENAMNYFFGVKGATLPPPSERRLDTLYRDLTGDYEFTGVFNPARISLASANTTTFAGLATNAMNKVVIEQMAVMQAWRWYENVTVVAPNDGTLHPMNWITYGGLSNLPTVPEGGSFNELTVDDAKESDNFTTYGGYVGITRKLIKNSDIQKVQAIPRALATSAVRTRSAAIAAIFTQESGTGPTLDDDSVVLFHASHSNIATTALGTDTVAWTAARLECFKHTEVNSGKRIGVYPKFLLVPADLYEQALNLLGWGTGMPTSFNYITESRGTADSRAVPLTVPDWTDATDWAYITDPTVWPVIFMSYSQNPGGNTHPAPEIFVAMNESAGLQFTNDTMPIKVRDEWAAGVNGAKGIGKRNVA